MGQTRYCRHSQAFRRYYPKSDISAEETYSYDQLRQISMQRVMICWHMKGIEPRRPACGTQAPSLAPAFPSSCSCCGTTESCTPHNTVDPNSKNPVLNSDRYLSRIGADCANNPRLREGVGCIHVGGCRNYGPFCGP